MKPQRPWWEKQTPADADLQLSLTVIELEKKLEVVAAHLAAIRLQLGSLKRS